MPTAQLRSLAAKSDKTLGDLERYWADAKVEAHHKFKKKDKHFWAYVVGIVKRRAGLSEEDISFKTYLLLIEDDKAHGKALERTGFWGKAGAGCIILARDTGRICLPKRSKDVEQPHTWGTWGGAIDGREAPKAAAEREVREEAGYTGKLEIVPLYVYKHPSGFTYHNFLAIVDKEFEPELNWETSTYRWCSPTKLPSPLHFGLKGLLADAASWQKIKDAQPKKT
jgi:8-oxo-dGTP pyrophosphatase MutT (NUDIX family)